MDAVVLPPVINPPGLNSPFNAFNALKVLVKLEQIHGNVVIASFGLGLRSSREFMRILSCLLAAPSSLASIRKTQQDSSPDITGATIQF